MTTRLNNIQKLWTLLVWVGFISLVLGMGFVMGWGPALLITSLLCTALVILLTPLALKDVKLP